MHRFLILLQVSILCYSFFWSPNGAQKVANTAENCKWHNFSQDLGVTPRILFSLFKILYREFSFGKLKCKNIEITLLFENELARGITIFLSFWTSLGEKKRALSQ